MDLNLFFFYQQRDLNLFKDLNLFIFQVRVQNAERFFILDMCLQLCLC